MVWASLVPQTPKGVGDPLRGVPTELAVPGSAKGRSPGYQRAAARGDSDIMGSFKTHCGQYSWPKKSRAWTVRDAGASKYPTKSQTVSAGGQIQQGYRDQRRSRRPPRRQPGTSFLVFSTNNDFLLLPLVHVVPVLRQIKFFKKTTVYTHTLRPRCISLSVS